MNSLVNAFTAPTRNSVAAKTFNGAETLDTSGHAVVDLFSTLGALQDSNQIIDLFVRAYKENRELAGRVSLWSRDIRGGGGRRASYRLILQWLEVNDFDMFKRFLAKTPELGRWDDMLVAQTEDGQREAYKLYAKALSESNGLAAKWAPRKGPVAARLREFMGLTPKQYRKLVVKLTNVVESDMCAKQWENINYSHVPSVAGSRYAKAFRKHDAARYQSWIDSLSRADSTAKMNVDALYPHDVIRSLESDSKYAEAAWKALPDYYDQTTQSILPIIDTSGSMTCFNYYITRTKSSAVTPMDVATGLGSYTAERNRCPFRNCVIPFSTRARFVKFNEIDSLATKVSKVQTGEVASTNLQASFNLILRTAVENNVAPSDMPTHVLIISDMEFDSAVVAERNRMKSENYDAIGQMYSKAGYSRPKIIFWNVNSRSGNNPVSFDENGTAMVAGYSPSIVKAALTASSITSIDVMMDTISNERYDY